MKVGIKRHDESIFASEVYRELERQAVRKGFFKPTEEQQVKLAAQEVRKEPELTGDLLADVSILAEGLRAKGYAKQASEIERKLVLFKQAEVHLYNVHDEEGEDVLNFAHKDGDVEIVPAQEERGKVETVQSAAKKILEVVQKQPTGKFASKTGLQKQAQDPFAKATPAATSGAAKPIEVQNTEKVTGIFKKVTDVAATIEGLRGTFDAAADQFPALAKGSDPKQNALYGQYLNIDPRQIPLWHAGQQALGGRGQTFSWDYLKRWVDSNQQNPGAINRLAQSIGVNVSSAVQNEKWDEATKQIKGKFDSLWNLLFGGNKQNTGIAKLKQIGVAAMGEIKEQPIATENVVSADGSINPDGSLSNLQAYNLNVKNVMRSESWQALNAFWTTLPTQQGSAAKNAFLAWWKKLQTAITNASREIGEAAKIAGGKITGLSGLILGEIRAWQTLYEQSAPNSDERTNSKASYDGLKQLYDVLERNDNAEFTQAMPEIQTLANIDPRLNVRSLKDLNAVIQAIAAESKANRGAK